MEKFEEGALPRKADKPSGQVTHAISEELGSPARDHTPRRLRFPAAQGAGGGRTVCQIAA